MIDLDEDVTRSSLKDCLDSGWTAQEIAEELGLDSVADVMRWCAYHELATPWQAQRAAAKVRAQEAAPGKPKEKVPKQVPSASVRAALWDPVACALYAAGIPVSDIAQIVQLSRWTIYRALRRYDASTKPKTQRQWWADKMDGQRRARKYKPEHVSLVYEHLGSLSATAKALGITTHYVKLHLKSAETATT